MSRWSQVTWVIARKKRGGAGGRARRGQILCFKAAAWGKRGAGGSPPAPPHGVPPLPAWLGRGGGVRAPRIRTKNLIRCPALPTNIRNRYSHLTSASFSVKLLPSTELYVQSPPQYIRTSPLDTHARLLASYIQPNYQHTFQRMPFTRVTTTLQVCQIILSFQPVFSDCH